MVVYTVKYRQRRRTFQDRYDHYIGGDGSPAKNQYFENPAITGQCFTTVARTAETSKRPGCGLAAEPGISPPPPNAPRCCSPSRTGWKSLEKIAVASPGIMVKPRDLERRCSMAIDHLRYFASAIHAQEGSLSQIDDDTVAYHYHEPLGVVGQIIPWNFPILMAIWKIAPALAGGNCIVLKPAEQTPASIMVLMELVGDLIPPGVLNVVNGFGLEAGKPLASSPRIGKIAFTGETTTGRMIMQYATENIIPVSLGWVVNLRISSSATSWTPTTATWTKH